MFCRKDSVVSEEINYDLLSTCKDVQEGLLPCPDLLGQGINSKTSDHIPSAIEKHLTLKDCSKQNWEITYWEGR